MKLMSKVPNGYGHSVEHTSRRSRVQYWRRQTLRNQRENGPKSAGKWSKIRSNCHLPVIMSIISPRETHDYRNYNLLGSGTNTSQKKPKI